LSDDSARNADVTDADVIIVGAGPAGSTAAFHLAQAGLDVLLLEKTSFPREKVCGDGLTPRAVKQLVKMGIDTDPSAGWIRNHGLRIIGGGVRLELPWPDLASFPDYGLVRPRLDFDDVLARHAAKAGARLREQTNVTGPIVDERTDRVLGVRAKVGPDRNAPEVEFRAPLVLAADGNSTRLSLALGLRKRDDRPMGVAVRTYYTSPRHDDDWLESWLELWDHSDPDHPKLLPGYGWIFGVGDGTSNVGLGVLNTSASFGKADYRAMLKTWMASTPEEWGYREENRVGPILGAALPMGFNRTPHYTRGVLLVGDAGGMVNPFNGEGICYAMESAELAAEVVVQALARSGEARERVLHGYPQALKDAYGGYYTLGRVFVKLIGNPNVMKLATRHGLPHPTLMKFVLKLLANLTDPTGGDAMDRIINGLSRMAPAA
jgi:geranylgeranyl reductase family protein